MPPNAGKGRVAGTPNKVTSKAREAIAMLADGLTPELQDWLRLDALGVGHAFEVWNPPEEWDGVTYPTGAKVMHRGKLVLAPVLDDTGVARRFTLADVIAGELPLGAMIDWIVKPSPIS